MANIREWLESAEAKWGEPIEAMVVGKHYRAGWDADPEGGENIVLTREAGLAKVDQEYDNGYGGAGCYPIWAWTASRVLFIHEYDGVTELSWVPRNPVAGEPEFGGNSW